MATHAPSINYILRPNGFSARGTGHSGIISATLIFVIFLLGLPLILAS